MIDKLYEIAKLENNDNEDIYSKLIDKFPENIDTEDFRLLILNFEESNGKFEYKDISPVGITANNKDTLAKQMWKINSKGNPPAPCACYSSKKPHTFINKITRFFSNKKGINVPPLYSCLMAEKDRIITEVKPLALKTTWVSLKLNDKFLSEIKEIDDKIKGYINKKKGFTKTDGSFKKGVCYLCHSENVDLVDSFKIPNMAFGTLDKKENISMNLEDKNEYKMCSICLDCQKLFNENFSNILLKKGGYITNFYGLRIIILPSLLPIDKIFLNQIKDSIKKYNYDYKTIKDEFKAIAKLKKDLKKFVKQDLEKKEKIGQEINNYSLGNKYLNFSDFGILSEYLDSSLIFSMVLYETTSSQFIIYDVVEDISKSRITKIAEIHKEIASKISNNHSTDIDLILYYKMLLKYQFDKESKDINDYIREDFICFIKDLLTSSTMSNKKLIKLFMDYIHKEFYNKEENKRDLDFLYFETEKFKSLLKFLFNLNCLEE